MRCKASRSEERREGVRGSGDAEVRYTAHFFALADKLKGVKVPVDARGDR